MIGSSKNIWGFDPRSIGGCKLWLDSADRNTLFTNVEGTTPVTTGTQVIAHWKDKSISGANVTNATVGPSYINSSPLGGLNFSSSKQLGGTRPSFSSGGICAFCVFNPTATSVAARGRMFRIFNGAYLASLDTTVVDIGTASIYQYQQNLRSIANVNNLYSLISYGLTENEFNINFGHSSTTWEFTSGPQSTGNVLELGATASVPFSGTISEIIVFDSFLTVQDKRVIEGYLGSKWGLPASTFNPTSVPNCIVWYDADDSTRFTGGTTWLASTGTNHAINGTPGITTMPTVTTWFNGRRAARFQAVQKNSMKTTSAITNFVSYFVVARIQAAVGYGFIIINNLDGQRQFVMNTTSFPVAIFFAPGGTAINVGSFERGQGFVFCGTIASNRAGTAFINGVQMGTNANSSISGSSQNYFGSANGDGAYLTFDLAEVLIYTGLITAPNRVLVENYLIRKWGLDFQTPPAHPFFYTRPYLREFQPIDIPGCGLWLDAADPSATRFQPVDGTKVFTWVDKSGNGINVSATGSPVITTDNGLKHISFDGSSYFSTDFTGLSGASYVSWFAVANITNAGSASYGSIVGTVYSDNFAQNQMYINSGNLMTFFRRVSGGTSFNTTVALSSDRNILQTITNYTNGNYQLYQNGVGSTVQTNGPTSTIASETAKLTIGHDLYTGHTILTGTISEILLYTQFLTTDQREKIESYLAKKWGLESKFSGSHSSKFVTTTSALPFLPTSIPGCELWLDAADLKTITPIIGGTLTGWTDKSGRARRITINSAPTYAITGFNGSYPHMSFASGNNLTLPIPSVGTGDIAIFAVWRQTTSSTQQNVFSLGVPLGGTEIGLGWNNGENRYKFYRFGGAQSVNSSATNNANVIGSAIQISGVKSLFINGIAANSTGTESFNQTNTTGYIGGTSFSLVGQLAELIFYVGTITTIQRQQLEGYLAQKWGLNLLPLITTPTSFTGCQLWLDAVNPAGVGFALNDGATVSSWVDRSGNSRNAITSTSANPPIYRLASNTIEFTAASSQSLTINSAFGTALIGQTMTMFFVGQRTVASGWALFLAGSAMASNQTIQFGFSDNQMVLEGYGPSLYSTIPTYTSPDPLRIYSFEILSSNSAAHYMNGSKLNSNTSNFILTAFPNADIGRRYGTAGPYSSFNLSEMIVYSPALNNAQRQRVEEYLAQRWRILPYVPSINPRSRIPPPSNGAITFRSNEVPLAAIVSTARSYLPLYTNSTDIGTVPQTVTTNGTVTYNTIAGRRCAYFNGSTANFLSLPYINQTNFTICFWFRTFNNTYWTAASITTALFDPALQIDTNTNNSQILVSVMLPNKWTSTPALGHQGTAQWSHVSVTINQTTSTVQTYIMGNLADTRSGSSSTALPSRTQIIIGKSGDNGRGFNGYINNFMFFNSILTAANIYNIYYSTSP